LAVIHHIASKIKISVIRKFWDFESERQALEELFQVSIGITSVRLDETRLRRDQPTSIRSLPGYTGLLGFILQLESE
jgi:hypothetical protein